MNEHMGKNTVIIVCRKKHEGMSHFMAQLISEGHKEYEVAEWDDKHWMANKATVPASQKVVFIGKAGVNYQHGIKWYFDKFSMKYGWRGNRAVLDVGLLNVKDIKQFRAYAERHAEEADASIKKMAGAGAVGVGVGGVAAGLTKFAGLMVGLKLLPLGLLGGPIAAAAYLNSLKKYQYPLLVKEFVLEGGFTKFMEG